MKPAMKPEMALYFPGAPEKPFQLHLADMPRYKPLDYGHVLDESVRLSHYMLDSVPQMLKPNGVLVSLSGGPDSSTVAAVCKKAAREYGKGMRLLCVTTSVDQENELEQRDVESARKVCGELGIEHKYIDTSGLFDYWQSIQPSDDAATNFDSIARLRHIVARREAEINRLLVAGTFTKSEFLLRAFTGGMAPPNFSFVSELYKTEVIGLGRHAGVPEWVLKREPAGSELQHTDRELYGIGFEEGLDAVLYLFESGKTVKEVSKRYNIDSDWLQRLHDRMTKQDWRVATTSLARAHIEN